MQQIKSRHHRGRRVGAGIATVVVALLGLSACSGGGGGGGNDLEAKTPEGKTLGIEGTYVSFGSPGTMAYALKIDGHKATYAFQTCDQDMDAFPTIPESDQEVEAAESVQIGKISAGPKISWEDINSIPKGMEEDVFSGETEVKFEGTTSVGSHTQILQVGDQPFQDATSDDGKKYVEDFRENCKTFG